MHLFGKRGERVFAVADIGSGSGGVCILATSGQGPARLLAAERCVLSFEERTLEATISGISAKLSEAAEKALAFATKDSTMRAVSEVYAIVRGPWTHSKAIRATSKLPKDTRIDGAMIGGLAKEALAEDTEFDRANIMEASVVRVELNGYATAQPEGKQAHTISVSVLLSELDPRVRAGISETLSRAFSAPPPTLRSGLRALISTLRESSALPKDCVIVDMTSEATHIVAVRKGVPAETAVVAEGKRSILKRIAGDKMPEEVLALMKMLEDDKCEPAACEAIKAAIAHVEPELVRVFGETIGKLAAKRRVPKPPIIAAHADLLPWLSRFFSRIDFTQFTVTMQPFIPKAIGQEYVTDLIDVPSSLSVDLGLLLAASLVNIEQRSTT